MQLTKPTVIIPLLSSFHIPGCHLSCSAHKAHLWMTMWITKVSHVSNQSLAAREVARANDITAEAGLYHDLDDLLWLIVLNKDYLALQYFNLLISLIAFILSSIHSRLF